jgi:folate-dependent tRNA-U54 methylase TrmFO/GidA
MIANASATLSSIASRQTNMPAKNNWTDSKSIDVTFSNAGLKYRSSNTSPPTNINYGLMPPLSGRPSKRDRRRLYASRALDAFSGWCGVAS